MNNGYPSIGSSIRKLADNVIKSSSPCDIMFGTVESVNPLSVRLSQKFILSEEFLVLTNAVRDHSVDINVSWKSDPFTCEVNHRHCIKGRKKITIYNGLTVGEQVILLRVQGGQNYVIIDRVNEAKTEGEDE